MFKDKSSKSNDKSGYSSHTASQVVRAKSKVLAHLNNKTIKDKYSIADEEKKRIEDELKELWRLFLTEYNYEAYYPSKTSNGNEKANNDNKERESAGKEEDNKEQNESLSFEVKYRIFLLNNQLEIQMSNNLLKSYSNKGSFALSHSELWIMHIKFLIERHNLVLSELFALFTTATNNSLYSVSPNPSDREVKKDNSISISLLAFFIIFIIEYIDKGRDLVLTTQRSKLPKCFTDLWKINRSTIIAIVHDGCYSKLFHLSTKKDKAKTTKGTEASFCTPKVKKKMKICFHKEFDIVTDLKNAKIIDNSIGHHGNYALIELSPNVQESTGHKYVFTPIKSSFNNKTEVSGDIKEVNDKYKDILYHPYNESIALKIKDNGKLSFG